MTFKQYVTNLNNFLKQHPETAEYLAVYSSDDEGNAFYEVWCSPCTGQYNGRNHDFLCEEDEEDNAVCVQ